jgi:hypothetical protein
MSRCRLSLHSGEMRPYWTDGIIGKVITGNDATDSLYSHTEGSIQGAQQV